MAEFHTLVPLGKKTLQFQATFIASDLQKLYVKINLCLSRDLECKEVENYMLRKSLPATFIFKTWSFKLTFLPFLCWQLWLHRGALKKINSFTSLLHNWTHLWRAQPSLTFFTMFRQSIYQAATAKCYSPTLLPIVYMTNRITKNWNQVSTSFPESNYIIWPSSIIQCAEDENVQVH